MNIFFHVTHITNRRTAIPVLCIASLSLSSCAGASDDTPASDNFQDKPLPITVTRGPITPAVSLNSAVIAAPEFTLDTPTQGEVTMLPQPGETIPAGKTAFTLGHTPVALPIDVNVVDVQSEIGTEVPENFPLLTVRYDGFALSGTVNPDLAWITLPGHVTGKAEITNSSGPFDCAYVAGHNTPTGASGGSDTPVSQRLCLVPPSVPAFTGATGTTVFSSNRLPDVLRVPVDAVAGRSRSGKVALIPDPEHPEDTVLTDVELGASDGTMIEIISGLTEGQTISHIAPNLTNKWGHPSETSQG